MRSNQLCLVCLLLLLAALTQGHFVDRVKSRARSLKDRIAGEVDRILAQFETETDSKRTVFISIVSRVLFFIIFPLQHRCTRVQTDDF